MPVPAGTSPFRDEPYRQMDGSEFASKNCVFAACTELIGRSTVGRLRVPAPLLRVISKDRDGGVTYSQAAEAVANATDGSVLLKERYGLDRAQVRDMAASGRGFCISLDCSVTVNTARATNSFTGFHTVYVSDYEWRTEGACQCERNLTTQDHGEFCVDDPGTRARYQWWSASLLYRAAERRGGGAMNTLAGPDTEGVVRVGRMKGRIRRTASTEGEDLGPVEQSKEYRVIATVNGGPWLRADGSTAFGWHKIEHQGGVAYVAGERLRQ